MYPPHFQKLLDRQEGNVIAILQRKLSPKRDATEVGDAPPREYSANLVDAVVVKSGQGRVREASFVRTDVAQDRLETRADLVDEQLQLLEKSAAGGLLPPKSFVNQLINKTSTAPGGTASTVCRRLRSFHPAPWINLNGTPGKRPWSGCSRDLPPLAAL